MRNWTVTIYALVSMAGCGGKSEPSSGDKACQDLSAKLAACHLIVSGVCNKNEPCGVECAAHADCSQLAASAPSGTYLTCIAACSGAGPDDFLCKDGKGYLKKAGVCDGIAQCLDGSDEASCGGRDAGPGGAGSAGATVAGSGGANAGSAGGS